MGRGRAAEGKKRAAAVGVALHLLLAKGDRFSSALCSPTLALHSPTLRRLTATGNWHGSFARIATARATNPPPSLFPFFHLNTDPSPPIHTLRVDRSALRRHVGRDIACCYRSTPCFCPSLRRTGRAHPVESLASTLLLTLHRPRPPFRANAPRSAHERSANVRTERREATVPQHIEEPSPNASRDISLMLRTTQAPVSTRA